MTSSNEQSLGIGLSVVYPAADLELFPGSMRNRPSPRPNLVMAANMNSWFRDAAFLRGSVIYSKFNISVLAVRSNRTARIPVHLSVPGPRDALSDFPAHLVGALVILPAVREGVNSLQRPVRMRGTQGNVAGVGRLANGGGEKSRGSKEGESRPRLRVAVRKGQTRILAP